MKTLYEQLKFDQLSAEIAKGLYRPVHTELKDPAKANAWSSLAVLLAAFILQARDSKRGFQQLNPEKIKGTWPKGYVIKKRDLV